MDQEIGFVEVASGLRKVTRITLKSPILDAPDGCTLASGGRTILVDDPDDLPDLSDPNIHDVEDVTVRWTVLSSPREV